MTKTNDIPCPVCDAGPGVTCVRGITHKRRVRPDTEKCPACGIGHGRPCTDEWHVAE
jgi:hypothetical protein